MSTCHQRTPSALSPGVQDAAPGLARQADSAKGGNGMPEYLRRDLLADPRVRRDVPRRGHGSGVIG